jgi:hypothetical protein
VNASGSSCSARQRSGSISSQRRCSSSEAPNAWCPIRCAAEYSSSVSTRRATAPSATGGGSTQTIAAVSSFSRSRPSATSRSARSAGVAELPTHQSTRGARFRSCVSARISAIVSSTASSGMRSRCTFVKTGPRKMQ